MKSITENFNLSLLEIFSVLLPGGAAILLFHQESNQVDFVYRPFPDIESEWLLAIIFIGASYFIGYVLFYLGSLLDDVIYEYLRFLLIKPNDEDVSKIRLAHYLENRIPFCKNSCKEKMIHYNALVPLINEMKNKTSNQRNEFINTLIMAAEKDNRRPEDDDNIIRSSQATCTEEEKNLLTNWFKLNPKNKLRLPARIRLLFKYFSMILPNAPKNLCGPKTIIKGYLEGKTGLFYAALDIKKLETGFSGFEVINLYKWSVAKLLISQPEMHAVVERHQTASKFFRSMVVVAILSIILVCSCDLHTPVWSSIVVLVFSLLIYLQQRYKGVRTAYEYIIVTSSLKT